MMMITMTMRMMTMINGRRVAARIPRLAELITLMMVTMNMMITITMMMMTMNMNMMMMMKTIK